MTTRSQGRSVGTIGLILIWLGFIAAVTALMLAVPRVFGWESVPYTDFSTSTDTIVQNMIVPLGIVAIGVIALVSFLGWWPFVWKDHRSVPAWMWGIPIILVVISLAITDWGRLGDIGASYALTLAAATLIVGFNEEVITRGVLLEGFRRTGSELHAWAWSTGLFALMHGANLFLGEPIQGVLPQLASTFMLGTLLYMTRRVSGGILIPIVVHALWDFSLLSHGGSKAAVVPGGDTGIVQLQSLVPLVVLGLFVVVLIAHKSWTHPEEELAAAKEE